jgi:glucosamine-phosphate N-acetyltransferase
MATIRLLRKDDLNDDYMKLLQQIYSVSTKINFSKTFEDMLGSKIIEVWIIDDDTVGKIIGSATIIFEPKFLNGSVARIDDIVIDSNSRNMGYGQSLIEHLVERAKSKQCYKVILNCNEDNITFYEKCFFEKKGVEMVYLF